MTGPQAKRTIILSLAAAGSLAAVQDLRDRDLPKLRIIFGAFFAGIVLSAVADGAPDLAGTFALLILTTTVFGVGFDTWKSVGNIFNRSEEA